MRSHIRHILKQYEGKKMNFIAIVQSKNKHALHLTLVDVYVLIDSNFIKVATHTHVFNVKKSEMKGIRPNDIISFKAVPQRYNKTERTEYGEVINIYNYGLSFISDINKIEVSRCVKEEG